MSFHGHKNKFYCLKRQMLHIRHSSEIRSLWMIQLLQKTTGFLL